MSHQVATSKVHPATAPTMIRHGTDDAEQPKSAAPTSTENKGVPRMIAL